MNSLTKYTGIGRSQELGLPSHRVAFAGSALAALVYLAFAMATGRSIVASLVVGISAFMAWAVGRELDPDRLKVAVWAIPLAFAASLYATPSAAATVVGLVSVRLIAGTVGAAITWPDVVVLAAIGFAAGSNPVAWLAGVAIAIWLLTAPEVGDLKYAALIALVGGSALGYSAAGYTEVVVTQDAYLLAAFGGAVMMLAMRPLTVESIDDVGAEPLHPGRVGLARKTAGAIVMWGAVMGGVAGFWAVSPVLAALVATAFAKWFSPGA